MAELFNLAGKSIYVAGHKGMVGSAIVRRLASENCEILTSDRSVDLREQQLVRRFFEDNSPDVVVVAAAKVGGIGANNDYPADFLYDNLLVETNLIGAARQYDTKKLLFLGSSCIYPKFANQPIVEEALLQGALEPTNQWYALAKIVGIKLCDSFRRQYGCDFISAMPTNLYGPGDNFDLERSHVLPALIRKIHDATVNGHQFVEVWGTGTPRREFLHVNDLADGCIFLLKNFTGEGHINIGFGTDIAISELAGIIAGIAGFHGEFRFDSSRPDGTPRKLMDSTKLANLGWKPKIGLHEGIAHAYRAFVEGDHH